MAKPVQVPGIKSNSRWKEVAKWINFLIKALLVLGMFLVIFQFYSQNNLTAIYRDFTASIHDTWLGYLLISILLIPVNWYLESLKWKSLLSPITGQKHKGLFMAVLSGVTVSLLTPNRIGEYVGRAAATPANYNWEVTISTLVGSFCQLIVLLFFGSLAAFLFFTGQFNFGSELRTIIPFIGALIIATLIFFFYNIDFVAHLLKRIGFIKRKPRILDKLMLIKNYRARDLSLALLFSVLRFTTYSVQYLLLIWFFGIDLPALVCFETMGTQFFLQAGIPLPPILGLVARGEISVWVFGFHDVNELSILAASFLLWGINLFIPSLIGMINLLKKNIIKSLGYHVG